VIFAKNKHYMKSLILSFALLASSSIFAQGPMVGGGCEYSKQSGSIKIVSIENAPAAEYNAQTEPKKVTFEFVGKDKKKHTGSLQYGAGMNPSNLWLKANKITVGKKFTGRRATIKKGTCTPVVFEFDKLNLAVTEAKFQ
jgi:hypothetical protein